MSRPHLWRLDKNPERTELVLAEARALGAGDEVLPGLFLGEAPYVPGRAAFGLGGGAVVADGPPGPLPIPAGHREVHVARGPWKASGHTAGFVHRLHPELTPVPRGCPLELYASEERWLLVLAAQPSSPSYVTPHLPFRNSTSLPSQLARAVVNLVARPGERVLDPVCGTGVLLVEAARIGCQVTGGDLSPKACHQARENLNAVARSGAVRKADALSAPDEAPFDALVGDLPYGRRLEPSALAPFARALPARARRWALVAHVDLSEVLADAGHAPREVIPVPKQTFTRFVHVGGEPLG